MRDPSWADLVTTGEAATTLNLWNGRPVQFLIPVADGGALLWWEFDERDNETAVGVIVHLTEDEAQQVFDRQPTVGLLERVRPTLADTEAAVFAVSRGFSAHRVIEIPRLVDEDSFIDFLLDEADKVKLGSGTDKLLTALATA